MWNFLSRTAFTLFCFTLFFCIFTFSAAQVRPTSKKLKPEKRHKMATKMVANRSYYNASEELEKLIEEHPGNRKYFTNLAESYFYARDYRNAERLYQELVKDDPKTLTLARFRYAECLKYNAKYEEALKEFQTFEKSKYKDPGNKPYKLYAKQEVKSCQYAIANRDHVSELEKIEHLGDHVNSAYSEFSPCLWKDSLLVFASLQSDSVVSVHSTKSHTMHVRLYKSPLWEEEQWGEAVELPQVVNHPYMNTANGAFSTDYQRFYFTRCRPVKDHKMHCELYMSKIENGEFQKPEKLEHLNAKHHTATQPQITKVKVGKVYKEVMFYASDRKGGMGGMDIWYSFLDKDGKPAKPSNPGKKINTIRDEITPFYDGEAQILYFSSNFYEGFGGYDIFRSSGNMRTMSTPENIGKPINTRVDDTYYRITNQGNKAGFFVSNRPEGYHLTSETCCDDIYRFQITKPFLLTFKAQYKNTPYRFEPIVTGNYSNEGKEALTLAENFSDTLVWEGMKNKLTELFDDKAIDKSFFANIDSEAKVFALKSAQQYVLTAYSPFDTAYCFIQIQTRHNRPAAMYFLDKEKFEIKVNNSDSLDIIEVIARLEADTLDPAIEVVEDEKTFTVAKLSEDIKKKDRKGLKVILNYDFDDHNFIKDHSGSLDSLVMLMKEYEDVRIEISAHTDNKGSHQYNLNLSKKRAHSILKYLQHHGIAAIRMVSAGYGEDRPLVPNENPDGSDNEKNRAINRRAEILIVE